ncbi:lipopolysaccharide core biosynthesis protein rfaS [Flavobacterium cerinum]|uniref:Lipopolysaccharide core biosynthesis protein rfaS n=1 Tax=Flavobacterium cerinum TaxID=2502784 RepID=A0ABY5ISN7_9FLAO|nr:lipopolysaccharide core biosynthesis protein rfaS [Flavobacterium cerinum]UUC45326.1 lipopolysaccharide core biosynthesis protein rfaS [Flavobacterium cerinum]
MKKRLLYIAPDHYDFYKIVLKGFQEYSDYEVVMVFSSGSMHRNVWKRLLHLFQKLFFRKNGKQLYFQKKIIESINRYDSYDLLYINRPDIFSSDMLSFISGKAKRSIVHYWDSFDKIKGQKETIPFFDIHYSFDEKDCLEYKIKRIHNFYFAENITSKPEHDVFFLGTYDKRFEKIKYIINQISRSGIKAKALFLSKDRNTIKTHTSDTISFIQKAIPFPESITYSANTRILLDVDHENQTGLSFRPFEAMGFRKKLITTNRHIRNYDFYNPDNIFIWTDTTTKIPESFLNTPYQEIPTEIRNKYSLKNWIESLLNV